MKADDFDGKEYHSIGSGYAPIHSVVKRPALPHFDIFSPETYRFLPPSNFRATGESNPPLSAEPVYSVTTANLTVRELRNSAFPDSSISAVLVQLECTKNMYYAAVHVPGEADTSYILLSSLGKFPRLRDMNEAAKSIVFVAGSLFGFDAVTGSRFISSRISDGNGKLDMCCPILLNQRPSKSDLADLILRYKKYFRTAYIARAYFVNVPKAIADMPNIAKEKVIDSVVRQHVSLGGIGVLDHYIIKEI